MRSRAHSLLVAGCVVATASLSLLAPRQALALDKQGSAHGGSLAGPTSGFDLSGNVFLGSALYNPSYAARPDNSGLVLLRYGAHADIDLIGRRLSIPIDVNFFTDRTRDGANVITPSEGDIIAGVTSTWAAGPGAVEVGVRGEHDRPIDRRGLTQSYVDARARYLWSLDPSNPSVSGWFTLGGFLVNPSYAARPDNSGLALLRYGSHTEMMFADKVVGLGFDASAFTDRREHVVRPSEIDLTFDLIGRFDRFDLHVAYERDMPVDRGGKVQQLVYFVLSASFGADLRPAEEGGIDMRSERRRARPWASRTR